MPRASSFTTRSERRTILRISPRAGGSCETRKRPTPTNRNGTEPNGSRTRTRARSGEADAVEGKRPHGAGSNEELDPDLLSGACRGGGRGHRGAELGVTPSRGSARKSDRQHAPQGPIERLRDRLGQRTDRGDRVWRLRVS